jgi:uroporphyrinogen decarboxylase
MSRPRMTSMERANTAASYQEPDRVPLFLNLSLHGAKELGLPLRQFFERPENVALAQLRLADRYHGDSLSAFMYASIEFEAFGGETIFREDGPPNAGQPVIAHPEDILKLQPPDIRSCPGLQKVLEATRQLSAARGGQVPILGVAISPFSLPVMQMGFEAYLNLMFERPELFQRLMRINQAFCIEWANAQVAAGATGIIYFDPVSSSTIVTPEQYLQMGYPLARRIIPQIKCPVGIHFASGRCLPILSQVAQTGAAMVGVSTSEDLRKLKELANHRVAIVGNLNGIEMRRWTTAQAEAEVKRAITRGGKGGGWILSDNHGEIPLQVPDDVLSAISEAVQVWGNYPLDWVEENA